MTPSKGMCETLFLSTLSSREQQIIDDASRSSESGQELLVKLSEFLSRFSLTGFPSAEELPNVLRSVSFHELTVIPYYVLRDMMVNVNRFDYLSEELFKQLISEIKPNGVAEKFNKAKGCF